MPDITMPVNPAEVPEDGMDFILKINTGSASVPIWTTVGGQRGTSLKQTAESKDMSSKTGGKWKITKAGLLSWSLDLDGLVILDDTGLAAMEQAFRQRIDVNVQILYPDATAQTGWAVITDFSKEFPHDGEATVKGTLEGNGELTARAEVA